LLLWFAAFIGNDSEAGMGAVALREDFGAAELRRLAGKTHDAKQARRLLAVAAVYDGNSRAEAGRIGGMDRQTLRDWVHRFNAKGPEGLLNAKPSGRPPTLSAEQKQELKEIVEVGPDPAKDAVVRWRCVDLRRVINERFGADLDEVSIGRILKELGFAHVSARPQHPAQDAAALEAFKKTSLRVSAKRSVELRAGR
jgi:transposase